MGRGRRLIYHIGLSLFATLTPCSSYAIEPIDSQPINVILPPLATQTDVPLANPETISEDEYSYSINVSLPPFPIQAETKPIGEDEQPELSLPILLDSLAIVVIDPGHGGPDPGAVGNGLLETEIVLDISLQVANLLQQQGIQALLTRNAEYDLDLEPRVEFANQQDATVFVSIHANALSLDHPEVNGVETFYFNSGQRLAEIIQASILEDISMVDRGARQARFYVLRHTSMPAALVETGFITGAEDSQKLADPAFRRRMAEAIARGIIRYFQMTEVQIRESDDSELQPINESSRDQQNYSTPAVRQGTGSTATPCTYNPQCR